MQGEQFARRAKKQFIWIGDYDRGGARRPEDLLNWAVWRAGDKVKNQEELVKVLFWKRSGQDISSQEAV